MSISTSGRTRRIRLDSCDSGGVPLTRKINLIIVFGLVVGVGIVIERRP